jgi:autotransporter translocation and assembly factor TamB
MRIAGRKTSAFTACNLDLGLIKPLLKPNQNSAGTFTAEVAITGTAAAPIVRASLTGQGLAIDAQRIGDLTLRADYAPGA